VEKLVREQQSSFKQQSNGTRVKREGVRLAKLEAGSSSGSGSSSEGEQVSDSVDDSSAVIQQVCATLTKAQTAQRSEYTKVLNARLQGKLPPKPQGYMALFKSMYVHVCVLSLFSLVWFCFALILFCFVVVGRAFAIDVDRLWIADK
jgi:hypothetical protein